jgi:hypothetical protein
LTADAEHAALLQIENSLESAAFDRLARKTNP